MPVSPYVRVRHVHVLDRLEMLDADDLPDRTRLHQLAHAHEIGRVAQHVTHADDPAGLLRQCQDIPALLLGRRDRLLEQYVVTEPQRRHRGPVVQVIGRADDDRVRELRALEYVLPGDDAVPLWNRVLRRVPLLADRDRLRDTDDLQPVRVRRSVVPIDVAARACPERDGRYGRTEPRECALVRED